MGLTIIALHFALLTAYVFKPGKHSVFYIYPFFHQNWNVFVPPPESNYNLYALFQNKELKRIDVFTEINQKHQSNRFAGNESLLLCLINSIHHFEYEANPVTTGANFKMIEHYAFNYLQQTRNIEIEHLRLILVVSKHNMPAKVYYN